MDKMLMFCLVIVLLSLVGYVSIWVGEFMNKKYEWDELTTTCLTLGVLTYVISLILF